MLLRKLSATDRTIDITVSRIRRIVDPHLSDASVFGSVRGTGDVLAGLPQEDRKVH